MALVAVCAAGAAQAGTVESAILDGRKITVTLHEFMSSEESQTLRLAMSNKDVLAVFLAGQEGHGALAISPDEGFIRNGQIVTSAVAMAGLPDIGAARAAALQGCEAKRKGPSDCVVVLEISPAS